MSSTSSLSPAENDVVRIAAEMLEAAGLAYVMVVQNRTCPGGDLFANVPAANVMRIAEQVLALDDLDAHQVMSH